MTTYPADELKERCKKFALGVIRFLRNVPKTDESRTLGRQLLRSATSVAANYRAACRARSKAEFVAKIGVVVEEADETVFWLELFRDASIVAPDKLGPLLGEANQLLSIFSASHKTARSPGKPRG